MKKLNLKIFFLCFFVSLSLYQTQLKPKISKLNKVKNKIKSATPGTIKITKQNFKKLTSKKKDTDYKKRMGN